VDEHLYLMYTKFMGGGETFYSKHNKFRRGGGGHLIYNVITNLL
jgi:hypothetical protein